MTDKFKKAPKFTTPPGSFIWPRLFEADTKFKAEGEYSVKLRLSADAASPLIKKLQPLHDEAAKEGKQGYAAIPVANRKKLDAKGGFTLNPFFSPVYDDDENETGEVEFKFTMKATGTNKKTGKDWTRKPSVFDAKGLPIKKDPGVGSGTVGKVSFEVFPYFIPGTGAAGLSLKLEAAQIIDLVAFGQRSASAYGFGEEEGYSASDNEDETEESNTEEGGASGDDDEIPF